MRANHLFIYLFYTPHLRRKSTMRRFFYHTDLVQNAVFHNFSRQIAFIQYSGLSKNAWTFNQRNRSKNVQNHLYSMWSLVCASPRCPWSASFPKMIKYFVKKKNTLNNERYRDLLISILSYDEVSAFLLRVKTLN